MTFAKIIQDQTSKYNLINDVWYFNYRINSCKIGCDRNELKTPLYDDDKWNQKSQLSFTERLSISRDVINSLHYFNQRSKVQVPTLVISYVHMRLLIAITRVREVLFFFLWGMKKMKTVDPTHQKIQDQISHLVKLLCCISMSTREHKSTRIHLLFVVFRYQHWTCEKNTITRGRGNGEGILKQSWINFCHLNFIRMWFMTTTMSRIHCLCGSVSVHDSKSLT